MHVAEKAVSCPPTRLSKAASSGSLPHAAHHPTNGTPQSSGHVAGTEEPPVAFGQCSSVIDPSAATEHSTGAAGARGAQAAVSGAAAGAGAA
eukprot:SAG22_NODE_4074_length_1395_cov_2.347222_3_plen_92_part_00